MINIYLRILNPGSLHNMYLCTPVSGKHYTYLYFFSTGRFPTKFASHMMCNRLQRWYVTIPPLDQWQTTIENHRNQWLPDSVRLTPKPSKNHFLFRQQPWKMTQPTKRVLANKAKARLPVSDIQKIHERCLISCTDVHPQEIHIHHRIMGRRGFTRHLQSKMYPPHAFPSFDHHLMWKEYLLGSVGTFDHHPTTL